MSKLRMSDVRMSEAQVNAAQLSEAQSSEVRIRSTQAMGIGCALAAVVCGLAQVISVPVLVTAIAGLFLLIVAPTVLVRDRLQWVNNEGLEPWLFALGATVIGGMVIPTSWNLLARLAGVSQPLRPWPLLVLTVVCLVGLYRWRRQTAVQRHRDRLAALPSPGGDSRYLALTDQILIAGAVAALALVVLGAFRLNNGRPGTVALLAMLLVGAVLTLLLARHRGVSEATVVIVVYLVALTLLWATALRGWDVTGHDIQREYRLLVLTVQQGYWQPGVPSSAYNACLSITVFPATIHELTRLPELSVFRLVFQPLFALTGVVVYRTGRYITNRFAALLGAVFYLIFPTFMADMPFLNRQEIAFLLLSLIVLAVVWHADPPGTMRPRSRQAEMSRRRWGLALAIGVLLAHYSTNYVLLVGLALGYAVFVVLRAMRARSVLTSMSEAVNDREPMLMRVSVLVLLVLLTFGWTRFTHSGGQLEETVSAAVQNFVHPGQEAGSSDANYSIFSRGTSLTPQQRLDQYRAETIKETAKERASGQLYPLSTVDQYPTPIAPEDVLPITAAGRVLQSMHLDVGALVTLTRTLSSVIFQLSILFGLLLLALGRFKGWVSTEYVALACASVFIIGTQVALPALSVDYGVLRAFQQALLVLAPLMAVAVNSMFTALRLGRLWASAPQVASALVVLAMFATLSGIVPRLVGGYPGQLHLENSGLYYDNYYVHPEEVSALNWVRSQVGENQLQAEVATDRYSATKLASIDGSSAADDLYPTTLRRDTYVLLGYPAVTRDRVSVFYSGDLLTYRYPKDLLNDTKNLVYSNGAAELYR